MDHHKVGEIWDENAEAWQEASENGHDIWRDLVNTPAFLEALPNISKLSGIDIGCGDGYNSRLIAQKCHLLTAIDISDVFLKNNQQIDNPYNISYRKNNASDLQFSNESFDFAVALMAFMDMPNFEKVLSEIYRVLVPGGFLQFSILHPCFNEQKGQWLKDENGNPSAFLMRDYFRETQGEIHEWQHLNSPAEAKKFRVPRFWKPLNRWFNVLIEAGFSIEKIYEPSADKDAMEKHPELNSTKIVAHSLIIRVRKQKNQKGLQNVLETLPGNVWWKDLNLIYLGCNDNVIKKLGLASRKDFIGKTDHDLWDKEIADKLEEADQHVLNTGETINLEEIIIQGDGQHVVMLTNKSPLRDEENKIIGVVGTSTDITERKTMEENLRIAKENAEVANQLKSEFIHNMEHDIRTPFGGIWQISQYLEDEETDPEKKELLGDMTRCGSELLEYLNSIIDFAKIEEGTSPIIAKKFDIKSLLKKIITMEKPAAIYKNLEISLELGKELPDIIIGDPHRLQRILINLTSNAIKFTQTGHVKIKAQLVKQEKKDIVVRFIIEDSGVGIPKEKITYIYEKFTRGTLSNQGVYKGSGLGLRVVKKLVEEVEGEIDVLSEEGKGTTFTCTIPYQLPLIEDILNNLDDVHGTN